LAKTVLDFVLKKNKNNKAEHPCLLAKFSLALNISYKTNDVSLTRLIRQLTFSSNYYLFQDKIRSELIDIKKVDTYEGTCGEDYTTLRITLMPRWLLVLNYIYSENNPEKKKKHSLDSIIFTYHLDDTEKFPDVANSERKKEQSTNVSGLYQFAANKDDSFKCWAITTIKMENVDLELSDYHAQPFMEKSENFDTGMNKESG
jgi:hypothetical protein